MPFISEDHRMRAYLENHLGLEKSGMLIKVLRESLSEVSSGGGESSPSGIDLVVKFAYALVKHRAWIENLDFVSCLQQHLWEAFRLEKGVCQIVSESVAESLSFVPVAEISNDSSSFLHYLMVEVLCHEGKIDIENEIGLGPKILLAIRQAIDFYSENLEQALPRYCADLDYDHRVFQIFDKLSKQIADDPSYLAEMKLFYSTLAVPGIWPNYFSVYGAGDLLEWLYELGSKPSPSLERVKDSLSKALRKDHTDFNLTLEGVCDLLDHCIKSDFLYLTHSGSRHSKGEKDRVHLSSLGYELTTHAFLKRQVGASWDARSIMSLKEPWQLAAVKLLDEKYKDRQLLTHLMFLPLSPRALSYLLDTLVTEDFSVDLALACEHILKKVISVKHRQMVCEFLSNRIDQERAKSLLETLASHDRSQNIREFAAKALEKHI